MTAVHHIALKVDDVAALAAYYGALLGQDEAARHTDAQGLRSVWYALGTAVLMIERSEAGAAPRDPRDAGWHLLALTMQPDQRAAKRAALAALGTPVTHESAYSLYFADPAGNPLAFSHYPEPAAD